ncbi:MarR family winged helix-turn-helix transcriptional regulator [Candidatus Enterococcus mansonii]|uniref:HTH marR-type domain-containing protein n=1 Tax=Candidatus Enterococcus mansonii TaxID=1834181 RepID=A0A242CCS5_9ENTE|nr:MarR family transcriptional regulator [Enterococcus sp. 4G2_DIV0659]OTO08011.1 hypothetical protein A5880_002281 [Enterococcus sp. 4G2_DIV0659]
MDTPLISQWLDYTKKHSTVEKKLEDVLKKKSQLTISEYYALYQLHQNGCHMRLNDLGNYLCLSQSALSRLIKRLEEKEPQVIIKKDCSADKRGFYVDLTDQGLEELIAIEKDVQAILEENFK